MSLRRLEFFRQDTTHGFSSDVKISKKLGSDCLGQSLVGISSRLQSLALNCTPNLLISNVELIAVFDAKMHQNDFSSLLVNTP